MEDTAESRTVGPSQLANPRLLDKIDKLFALNIGEHVELPQLVVVGDQSSGKSSVLEGLTGIAFPRNSGLCTRFATQIVFRRSSTANVRISIIPAADAGVEHAEKMRAWKNRDQHSLRQKNFGKILAEVSHLMGIDNDNAKSIGKGRKSFANDVLRIERYGPEEEHLSVIDVPGIFRSPTEGITTNGDIEMVKSMVLNYMKNARSVILAVVPANTDVATQEILQLAQPYDPHGRRTLGVLTKPDLVDEGAEQDVIKIISGKSNKLALGWCIVRNPGQKDLNNVITQEERHAREKDFFRTKHPWTKVAKDKAGIEALRSRLVEILGEMVQREFLQVKLEIGHSLQTMRKDLASLGPARESRNQQHSFLLDLASRFQTLTSLALKAAYGADNVFEPHPTLKLATAIVNRNSTFSKAIACVGHTYDFKQDNQITPDPQTDENDHELEDDQDAEDDQETEFGQDPEAQAIDVESNGRALKLTRIYSFNSPELEGIVAEASTVADPISNAIMPWLREIHKDSRGYELGTFDASILPIVWKKQSTKWDALAVGYISDVVELVHTFTLTLISAICSDPRVKRELIAELMDHLLSRYKEGVNSTSFILRVEREGTPLTTNHYFAGNLEKSRQARFRAQLEAHAFVPTPSKEPLFGKPFGKHDQTQVVKIDTVLQTSHASNADYAIYEIHDILRAYYKVARKRFVDNICMQAADYHLVNGPDSPIKVFSPSFVGSLSDEQLQNIAGEDSTTRRKRAQLKKDIENLEQGRKILG